MRTHRRVTLLGHRHSSGFFVCLVAENVEDPVGKFFQHVLAGYQDTNGCPIINYNHTQLRLLSQN